MSYAAELSASWLGNTTHRLRIRSRRRWRSRWPGWRWTPPQQRTPEWRRPQRRRRGRAAPRRPPERTETSRARTFTTGCCATAASTEDGRRTIIWWWCGWLIGNYTAKKSQFMLSFSWHWAASVPISTFMCLWAFCIFLDRSTYFPLIAVSTIHFPSDFTGIILRGVSNIVYMVFFEDLYQFPFRRYHADLWHEVLQPVG